MAKETKVEVLQSWEEEHIVELEERIEKLHAENAELKAQLATKPQALDYKQKYEEVLEKLHQCWRDQIPF